MIAVPAACLGRSNHNLPDVFRKLISFRRAGLLQLQRDRLAHSRQQVRQVFIICTDREGGILTHRVGFDHGDVFSFSRFVGAFRLALVFRSFGCRGLFVQYELSAGQRILSVSLVHRDVIVIRYELLMQDIRHGHGRIFRFSRNHRFGRAVACAVSRYGYFLYGIVVRLTAFIQDRQVLQHGGPVVSAVQREGNIPFLIYAISFRNTGNSSRPSTGCQASRRDVSYPGIPSAADAPHIHIPDILPGIVKLNIDYALIISARRNRYCDCLCDIIISHELE